MSVLPVLDLGQTFGHKRPHSKIANSCSHLAVHATWGDQDTVTMLHMSKLDESSHLEVSANQFPLFGVQHVVVSNEL